MKQWIFTAALSISLVCGHLEAAGGEYSIRKELAGQEQAVQTQEVQSRAVQVQEVQSRAVQVQEVQGRAVQAQASQTENADFLKLYAQSAVLMDGSSGRILYGKGQDIIRPMASTTKIMTCILALELGNLDDKVTASSYAASQPKVHLGVRSGEEYRLEDLLYALMLESYNDAAVMIAENIGGSVEDFAALMNQKAEELGCRDTYFITPNGLDGVKKDKDGVEHIHSTTAADLAAIMRYCVMESPKKEEFLSITRTQNHTFTDSSGRRSYSCFNHNAFLNKMCIRDRPCFVSCREKAVNCIRKSKLRGSYDGNTLSMTFPVHSGSGFPPNK